MGIQSALRRIRTWREPPAELVTVPQTGAQKLAVGLGVFSVALGVAELVVPSKVARLVGFTNDSKHRALLRATGLREISTGLGILTHERPSQWLWGRVGGDMLDLSLLTRALTSSSVQPERTALATAAVLGVTLLDVVCARGLETETPAAALANRQQQPAASEPRQAALLQERQPPLLKSS